MDEEPIKPAMKKTKYESQSLYKPVFKITDY